MSVEAVGQDLEGFREPNEKDGGGGPIVRGSRSSFASSADGLTW